MAFQTKPVKVKVKRFRELADHSAVTPYGDAFSLTAAGETFIFNKGNYIVTFPDGMTRVYKPAEFKRKFEYRMYRGKAKKDATKADEQPVG